MRFRRGARPDEDVRKIDENDESRDGEGSESGPSIWEWRPEFLLRFVNPELRSWLWAGFHHYGQGR